ncbi:LysE family translocator [Pigmentiphaga sp. H8]|uniref:LysE family translocator n=1 Tax=Pigmentiphaga sp. H8 TaxID=2488560 RepID=UPI000F59755C|nr:LysE family translocator [Pigmentiphaga sp. H8]AZG10722.1 LysE family translocator [Pigmentiphaga sp. H8]
MFPHPRIPRPPMTAAHWGLYLSIVLASTLSPGPAVLLAMSNGAAWGCRASVFSTLGNVAGLVTLAVAALIGIGGVLAASGVAYAVLQLAGAAYLVYLGVKKWRAADMRPEAARLGDMPPPASLFTQGLLVALSNPKAILFFLALLPQFIQGDRALLPQFAALTSVLSIFSFAALMGYSMLARAGRRLAPGSGLLAVANRTVAGIFVVLGVSMMGRIVLAASGVSA